jgi:hypothetical protein
MIAAPLFVFNSLNCGDDKTSVNGDVTLSKEGFSDLIYSQPTLTLNSTIQIAGKGYVIPKTAITSDDNPYIFRIITKDGKTLFEDISISVVEDLGENIIAQGLTEGDIILINPNFTFTKLRKINSYELKRSFLRTQEKFFGK